MTCISKQSFYLCIQIDSDKDIGHTELFLSMTFHKVDLQKRRKKCQNVKCIIVVHPALALTLIWYAGVDKTKLLKNVVFNYQLKRYKNRKLYNFVERKINFISLKNANMMPLEEMRLPLFPTAYLSRAQKGNTSIHFIF